jgi:hypothetical protein
MLQVSRLISPPITALALTAASFLFTYVPPAAAHDYSTGKVQIRHPFATPTLAAAVGGKTGAPG